MNTPVYQHQQFQDDEIDLFELAEKLWNKKLLIIAITGIFAVIAVAVALMLPPTWQSEARVYKATTADLASINRIAYEVTTKEEFTPLTPEESLHVFYRYLTAPSVLRSVFNNSGLAEKAIAQSDGNNEKALAIAFEAFRNNLDIQKPNGKNNSGDYFTIKYSSEGQEFAANLINKFLLPAATQATQSALSQDLAAKVKSYQDSLSNKIFANESLFLEQGKLRAQQLSHALTIAQAGGIVTAQAVEQSKNEGTRNDTLYLLGTELLTAALNEQKKETEQFRYISQPKVDEENKPLLAEVAPLEIKRETLSKLTINLQTVEPVTIDEPAAIPTSPVKPKKRLIVALGVVLGGMLGVFIALIQIAIASRKEKLAQKAQAGHSPLSADATFR